MADISRYPIVSDHPTTKQNPPNVLSSSNELELPECQSPTNVQSTASQHRSSQFRAFSIATDTNSLSSGFPYSQRLVKLGISPEQWLQFSNQVVNAAKLTRIEDIAAWTTGVATGAGAFALLFLLGPVIGYYTGKSIHKKTVVTKVKEKLAEESSLRFVFRHWNDGIFGERGVQAMLCPPTESGEVVFDEWPGASPKDLQKEARRLARKFRIVLMPFDARIHSLGTLSLLESPVSPQSEISESWSPVSPLAMEMETNSQQVPELQSNAVARSELPARTSSLQMVELPSEESRRIAFELDGNSTTQ